MKSKIKYSIEAVKDLKRIKEYILLDTFNLDYANKLLKNIVTKINQLNEFPYIGPLLSIKIKVKTNYRYLICNKYIIFYKVDNKQIFVVRILHSRMDYAQVFFGEKQENKVTS